LSVKLDPSEDWPFHRKRLPAWAKSLRSYSLPSICDRQPAAENISPGGDSLVLAEDERRQFERTSRALAVQSDAEIAAIRAIHESESASDGWKRMHVSK
jgi:hypothetical protein